MGEGVNQRVCHGPTLWLILSFSFSFVIESTLAATTAPLVSDVTTRAFSVVWAADEPVANATTVRIYDAPVGGTELTSEFLIELVSEDIDSALANGIVKVDVIGLESGQSVFVEAVTEPVGGPTEVSARLQVVAATTTTKADADNTVIVNDLILSEAFAPDGITPGEGMLVILNVTVPGTGVPLVDYPITAFVGDGTVEPSDVILDMNNLYSDGVSTAIPNGAQLDLTAYRGALCPDLVDQGTTATRRVPAHTEDPAITDLEVADRCFSPLDVSADFNCDSVINLRDFGAFAAKFGLSRPDCRYSDDFNLFVDVDQNDEPLPAQQVDLSDFGRFASVFGETESP